MDFSGRIILSYIEEDNIQRAYFRVRPLLTEEGEVPQPDIDALGDEGYLRVVPDKNEQHTFKERMRSLGALCVLDLCNLPPDVVKIRTNKNYAPQRGENNQFIVYSDAVQSIPQHLFYEVISAESGETDKISRSVTPMCYLRSGGKIHGPVSRVTGLEQEDAAPLPPDSNGIYAVVLPDGAEKLFYWPRTSHPVERGPEDRLEEGLEFRPEAADTGRLTGMPLYQTVARRPSLPQRAHNPLMDAVGQQMRAGRVEAPGAVISAGTAMRPVENPMDAFRHSLETLWTMPDMQQQAVAHFLSMTGIQNILNRQLAGRGADAVTSAMNSQIQDLEAERLALLMQVEAARKNMADLRREAVAQAGENETETLRRLQQQADAVRRDMEQTEAARKKLLEERDALLAEMEKAGSGALSVCAEIGGYADMQTLCDRVIKSLHAAGVECVRNDAVSMLTMVGIGTEQIELSAGSRADALGAARAFAASLGVQAAKALAGQAVQVRAGGDSLRMAVFAEGSAEGAQYLRLIAASGHPEASANASEAAYAWNPWPVVYLKSAEGFRFEKAPVCPPVKAEAVQDAVARSREELPEAALRLLEEIDGALQKAGAPLPCQVKTGLYDYLCCAAAYMDGGIAAALDWGISSWIVPHVRRSGIKGGVLLGLVQGLPKTMSLLER